MWRLSLLAGHSRRLAAAVVLAGLAACASAPVQEMSDARQAIHAAEEAGAESHAPEALSAAKRALQSAEQKLAREAYNGARNDAREARRRAAEALEAARLASDSD
jgi:hypothetical protein